MTSNEQILYNVFNQVRLCFNQLKLLTEQLHQDLGINPSMRAVMEALVVGGRMTVPEIAQRRSVSRQHIQNIMNALLAEQLVEAFNNPAHKRSPLYDLTAQGRATFASIGVREKEPLRRMAGTLSAASLQQAQESLVELNRCITGELAKGDIHGKPSS